ncbi:hypothetical protein CTAYLR_003140 [Chrysophaeum taylorii]|uniref:Histone-lysine N-methyltransferase, H3 lysine-79 specific n=1 Tax=Chrysophaeum taylorii TaxID=2483200 RepID=A0AAD7UNM2_9STRA|nr:hypothetical protein CTAYLR_003140 [Chrysophaeum taylorii]
MAAALELSRQSEADRKRREEEAFEAEVARAMAESRREERCHPPYPLKIEFPLLGVSEFVGLWRGVEARIGHATSVMEKSSLVKEGNARVSSRSQEKAQYGRLLFGATQKVIEILDIKRDETFVDIGSGIGNVVMQVACTVGCASRGLELMPDRVFVGSRILTDLEYLVSERGWGMGDCDFKQGNLTHEKKYCDIADAAFVNNFEEVFGARSAKTGSDSLDRHVASIFAAMRPGSRMLTLEPLTSLGLSRKEANLRRKDKKNDLASFFEVSEHSLSPARYEWHDEDVEPVASWSTKSSEITAYLYLRTEQHSEDGPMYLCSNHRCQGFVAPTLALDDETRMLVDRCVYCDTPRRIPRQSSSSSSSLSGRKRAAAAAAAPPS